MTNPASIVTPDVLTVTRELARGSKRCVSFSLDELPAQVREVIQSRCRESGRPLKTEVIAALCSHTYLSLATESQPPSHRDESPIPPATQ